MSDRPLRDPPSPGSAGAPWWLGGGVDDECAHCGQPCAPEAEYRCAGCDAAVCPFCARQERGEAVCPDCAAGGD